METLQPYLEAALKKEVDHAIVIETSKILTEPWVRMRCQFGCFMYGKSLCCPPRTPTPDEMRKILDDKQYFFLDEFPFVQEFLEHLLIDGLLFFRETYILDSYIVQD